MKIITATTVQNRFGQYLDECDREAVGISRNGRIKGILMGIHEYDALKAIEAAYLADLANSATDADFLGPGESEAILGSLPESGVETDDDQAELPQRRKKVS
ncbi:type II toxin-antitoxin system Phd/YefM family antitoxin [Skermanella mucosa]|uniref:type II toxin-antitoxin system Phd/YefM family antitoxin n=1 Tax=Skermanella mucosa TaxID=1789672 RepID=UPI00192C9C98|nr:type II toxin-antitoxin system Phd/YefM family antitoxin [Skermanella mucosa]UEM18810.1 type II toxin-antitoxin system Phd/YefM family antitoxin [Skermanella mucosa]